MDTKTCPSSSEQQLRKMQRKLLEFNRRLRVCELLAGTSKCAGGNPSAGAAKQPHEYHSHEQRETESQLGSVHSDDSVNQSIGECEHRGHFFMRKNVADGKIRMLRRHRQSRLEEQCSSREEQSEVFCNGYQVRNIVDSGDMIFEDMLSLPSGDERRARARRSSMNSRKNLGSSEAMECVNETEEEISIKHERVYSDTDESEDFNKNLVSSARTVKIKQSHVKLSGSKRPTSVNLEEMPEYFDEEFMQQHFLTSNLKHRRSSPPPAPVHKQYVQKTECRHCGARIKYILSHLSKSFRCQVDYDMTQLRLDAERNKRLRQKHYERQHAVIVRERQRGCYHRELKDGRRCYDAARREVARRQQVRHFLQHAAAKRDRKQVYCREQQRPEQLRKRSPARGQNELIRSDPKGAVAKCLARVRRRDREGTLSRVIRLTNAGARGGAGEGIVLQTDAEVFVQGGEERDEVDLREISIQETDGCTDSEVVVIVEDPIACDKVVHGDL